MARKQITIYLDDEQINRLQADRGHLNKRVIDLIEKGLQAEQDEKETDDNAVIKDLRIAVNTILTLKKENRLVILPKAQPTEPKELVNV